MHRRTFFGLGAVAAPGLALPASAVVAKSLREQLIGI